MYNDEHLIQRRHSSKEVKREAFDDQCANKSLTDRTPTYWSSKWPFATMFSTSKLARGAVSSFRRPANIGGTIAYVSLSTGELALLVGQVAVGKET